MKTTDSVPEPSLDLRENDAFQRREWRVQRAAWCVFALVILAAILGVFGKGPLSNASARDSALEVDYERFGRWRLAQRLQIRVLPPLHSADFSIWVSREYLESFEIDFISPEPLQERVGADRIEFDFSAADNAPTITFALRPVDRGVVRGSIGVAGHSSVTTWQFIYP